GRGREFESLHPLHFLFFPDKVSFFSLTGWIFGPKLGEIGTEARSQLGSSVISNDSRRKEIGM
ncbi:MAG: hypothetical protein KDD62_11160, partial [Bdellovibrionales bacterium]|nr:hypothetical protein [Bdellovibrionales bacterium]